MAQGDAPLLSQEAACVAASLSDLTRHSSCVASRSGSIRHIQRLIYLSKAADPQSWCSKFLEEWEESSRQRNNAIGVSGFLLYNSPYVFEVLEGFPEVIGPLFHSIRQDPRFQQCIVLVDVYCTERKYPGWHAHWVTNAAALQVMIPTLLGQVAQAFLSMWQYLPRSSADIVLQGKDPRKEPPESRDVVIAFVQIVEFHAILSHPALSGYVADLVGLFMDVCAQNMEGSGGQVAKFLNGTCMMYWPASCAAAALEGVTGIASDLAVIRDKYGPYSPYGLLYSRAGIHCGHALLCNVGNAKADFILLGDSINVAAHLAILANRMHAPILLSDMVKVRTGDEGGQLEDVGAQQIKGRNQPVECFRPSGPLLDGQLVLQQIQCFNGDEKVEMAAPQAPLCDFYHINQQDRPMIFQDLLHCPPALSSSMTQHHPKGCFGWLKKRFGCNTQATDLVTILYISRAASPMTEGDLIAIQHHGSRRNRARQITSELLYLDGLFAQTLEGPAATMCGLWDKLKKDSRHTELVIAHMAAIDHRVCTSPLSLHVMTEAEIQACPVLPEILGQVTRSLISLEAYVPYTVVQHIRAGRDPHQLPPVRVDVIMMACDVVCFTSLSEGCPLSEVWQICTTFIDLCTSTIREAGGQIIKIIGDCVTAYFPPSAAPAAVTAAKNTIRVCRMRRQYVHPLDCRSVMACAIGLDYGPVVMASCGSKSLSKFVVTGEVSARVMDVLPITRIAGRKIIFTKPVMERMPQNELMELVSSTPSFSKIPCFSVAGTEWALDVPAIRSAIQTYHRACETVCSTPYQELLPETKSEEQPPIVALMSCDKRADY
eukprot:GGOE01008085.1.p1 GENE.GGOE01008085.1~~GGOE01008085.1.p1  ORF type:complete len:827 (-),score=217.49 GGOE01008085.1:1135-3615(-)